jgi:hypothetical protein
MKFDKPTTEAILKDISEGIPYRVAAESNGVAHSTLKLWVAEGTKDFLNGVNSKYAQFLTSLREVEKKNLKRHLSNIENDKGHKGSEWLLERCFWQYFSAKAAEVDLNDRLTALEQKRSEDVKSQEDGKKDE